MTTTAFEPLAADTTRRPRQIPGPGDIPRYGNRSARPPARSAPRRKVRAWPLFLLAAPAAVVVWSGWVGIGEKTGFGLVRPLPGIWDALHLDTAVTLPIGVEAYAAYALRAWLASGPGVSSRTRRFAKWSALLSLLLGMAGQVAYHLLTEAGAARAPWGVTTVVSCLPVLVLGMGTALAHLLRADAEAPDQPGAFDGQAPDRSTAGRAVARWGSWPEPDHACQGGTPSASPGRLEVPGSASLIARPGGAGRKNQTEPDMTPDLAELLHGAPKPDEVRDAARKLAAAGQYPSRRNLRNHGVKGSNARLGVLADMLRSELATAAATAGTSGQQTS